MKKEIQNKKIGNKHGFSLIEVIVSIFLITVGLIASVDLITKGLRESMDSRDQLIAAELAQEGVEITRNVRDNNWVQGNNSFNSFPAGDTAVCIRGPFGTNFYEGDPRPGVRRELYIYSSAANHPGFYGHSDTEPGEITKFQRIIIIEKPGGSEDLRVIYSVVTWGGNIADFLNSNNLNGCNASSKCVYTKTILSKWGEGVIN